MTTYIFSFVLLLGPLVFVHELGHFLFARLFNVRCDAFSLGFGPKIFRKKVGETDYCLSLIPLGGYVKLLGQDPSEKIEADQVHRTLNAQDPWKRFLIYFGGPLFNFLFAVFVYTILMLIGEPHVSSVVERVPAKTAAYEAGFRSGDMITAVGNTPVNKIEEVNEIVSKSINQELTFRVKRLNEAKELVATPKATSGFSIYGEAIDVGAIEGLNAPARHPIIAVTNPKTLAGKAGLKTGDEIILFNGNKIKNYEELEVLVTKALQDAPKGEFKVGIAPHGLDFWQPDRKPEASKTAEKEVVLPAKTLTDLGIHSSELVVSGMLKGSPSEMGGVKPGDRLVSVDGKELNTFADLKEQVQFHGEASGKINLVVERAGDAVKMTLVPTYNETKDATGKSVKQFLIGIYPLFIQSEPPTFIERIFNPFTLAIESWSRSFDLSAKTVISLKKLATRQVSMGTLGGPLLIGKLAGDSFERGIAHFLRMMALISISLCVFNLLPVPILDGGHITLLFLEVLRGKPISMRQSELVQQVGVTLILLLLVVVMFNDISRVGIPALRRMFE